MLYPRRSLSLLRHCRCRHLSSSAHIDRTTHFGYKDVPIDEKKERVGEVFTRVAEKYDLMNDVMSGGMHRVWKHEFLRMMNPQPGIAHLDVAGGTGDIAFGSLEMLQQPSLREAPFSLPDPSQLLPAPLQALLPSLPHNPLSPFLPSSAGLPKLHQQHTHTPASAPPTASTHEHPDHPHSSSSDAGAHAHNQHLQQDQRGEHEQTSKLSAITVCDINPDMLGVGEKRAFDRGYLDDGNVSMRFVEGDAEVLPFEDESFDVYTIAFGLRNVTRIDVALKDAYRVLKPGGRFMCLEFSKVDNFVLQKVYDSYSFNVIPAMGELVAQDKDSYEYLVESIRKFPQQEQLMRMMHEAGFRCNTYKNMTFGVVCVHSGFKL